MGIINLENKRKFFNDTDFGIDINDVEKQENKEKQSGGINNVFSSISTTLFRYLKYFIVFFFCYYIIDDCSNGLIQDKILSTLVSNLMTCICLIAIGLAYIEYNNHSYFKTDTFLKMLGIKSDSVIYKNNDQGHQGDQDGNEVTQFRNNLNTLCYDALVKDVNSYITITPNIMNYIKFWYVWGANRWETLIEQLLSDDKETDKRCLMYVKSDKDNGEWVSGIYNNSSDSPGLKLVNDKDLNLVTNSAPTSNIKINLAEAESGGINAELNDVVVNQDSDVIKWPLGPDTMYTIGSMRNFFDSGSNELNLQHLKILLRKSIYATKIKTRFDGYKSLRSTDFETYKELFTQGNSIQTKYNSGIDKQDPMSKEQEMNVSASASASATGNISSTIGKITSPIKYEPEKIQGLLRKYPDKIPTNFKPYMRLFDAILAKNPTVIAKQISSVIEAITPVFLKTSNTYRNVISGEKDKIIKSINTARPFLPHLIKNIITPQSIEDIISGNETGIEKVLNSLPETYKKQYIDIIGNGDTNIGSSDNVFGSLGNSIGNLGNSIGNILGI